MDSVRIFGLLCLYDLVLQDDVGWTHVKGYHFCQLSFDGQLGGMSLQLFPDMNCCRAVLRCAGVVEGGTAGAKYTVFVPAVASQPTFTCLGTSTLPAYSHL